MTDYLKTLYSMRTLSRELSEKYLGEAQAEIDELLAEGFIEEVSGKNGAALFLTTKGVNAVKGKLGALRHLTASELKIKPHNIAHQMALNSFVLEYSKRTDKDFKYYDEKFMPKCSGFLMPDGLIEQDDTLYLLEMDMGAEFARHLCKKWVNYRGFLRYPDEYYCERNAICVFILENVKSRITQRTMTVMKTAMFEISDLIGRNFDIYIAERESCLGFLLNGVSELEEKTYTALSRGEGFKIFKPSFYPEYRRYIALSSRDNKIVRKGGTLYEFFLDFFYPERLSSLKSVMMHNARCREIKKVLGREVPLIMAAEDIEKVCFILRGMRFEEAKNVYFLDVSRLQNVRFHEALFKVRYDIKEDRTFIIGFSDVGLKDEVLKRAISY